MIEVSNEATQVEFFKQFAENSIVNLIIAQTHQDLQESVRETALEIVAQKDLSELSSAIQKEFLSNVSFDTVLAVDAFLRSSEYAAVCAASDKVFGALHELIGAEIQETALAIAEALGIPVEDETSKDLVNNSESGIAEAEIVETSEEV